MRVPTDISRSSTEAPVTASLTITGISAEQARRAARPPGAWSADDVFEYIREEIARLTGPQLPFAEARQTIEGFCSRFTIPVAVRIARAAFEVHHGFWQGAPITWRRFAPGHDEFFAQDILAAMT